MKILIPFLLLLIISCNKQDQSTNCNFAGTWQQVIKLPGEPNEILGFKMELLSDGTMKMVGITSFVWKSKDNCKIIEFYERSNKNTTFEMKVIAFDATYLQIELAGGVQALIDPLGVLGIGSTTTFKRIN